MLSSLHVYQNQILQCQKQRRNGAGSTGFESFQRVDIIMGDDGGHLQDSINYFDNKPLDFDQNGEQNRVDEDEDDVEQGSLDFRNRIARQWQCPPALALKALESVPVRNLFRVAQSVVERKTDGDESFVKSEKAFLSFVDDDGKSEKKLVTIMMAFQRWRQNQLKNTLGQELVKVLEEAREDEIARASLETQLEHMEQLLATERSKSAMLHNQLATAVKSTKFHENGYIADNATVSKTDRQVMTMEDFKVAEAEIELRDNQIQQLKERIRGLEEKIGRVDGQLNRLHLERSELQAENSIILRENRSLLEQLSSRDKEVAKQVEEMERLKALTSRLKEQQNAKQHRIDSVVAEHSAEVKILQEQLQQAYQANSCKEVELATSVEHCSHLKHEKGTLLMQLQEAEKRADLASTRAEELCLKLQSRSDGANDSAEIASEMVKHLKKLTQNVRELETTMHATDANAAATTSSSVSHAIGLSLRNNRTENTASDPCFADQVYHHQTFPQKAAFRENYPLCSLGYAQQQQDALSVVSLSSGSDLTPSELPSATRHSVLFQDGVSSWITWKWRWAVSSARADLLARKLHSFHEKLFGDPHVDQKQQRVQELMQRLGIGDELKNCSSSAAAKTVVAAEPKLVPLILAAWRASTRTSVLQRRALSRNASLDKMLDALPWWIRRARERRQLERTFFQWLVFTLSAKRQPHPYPELLTNQPRSSKGIMESDPSYEDSRTTVFFKPQASFSTKLRQQVKGSPDETNPAMISHIRSTPRASAAACYAAAPKPRVEDSVWNQLPRASQTRALQAFQTTLQQEVTELKKIAGQEIQCLQRCCNSQVRSRPVTAPTESSYAKQRQPDGKKVLKSVLGVCNNLALALTNVRGKLGPHVRADTSNTRRAVKLSPRVLADTVNACILNERTKIVTKGPAARELQAEAQSSPRAAGNSRGGLTQQVARPAGNSNQAWELEGWGTQTAAATTGQCNYAGRSRKPVAQERRTRTVTSSPVVEAPEPCHSRYQSPFRSQATAGTTVPNLSKKSSRVRTERLQGNTTKDAKCHITTCSQTVPVQETGRFKRPNVARDGKRPKPGTSNQVLNMSVINKVLGEGATNASLEEKKLVGSALARLVSTKISKLRGGQAV